MYIKNCNLHHVCLAMSQTVRTIRTGIVGDVTSDADSRLRGIIKSNKDSKGREYSE